jgi:hypothetical protein
MDLHYFNDKEKLSSISLTGMASSRNGNSALNAFSTELHGFTPRSLSESNRKISSFIQG